MRRLWMAAAIGSVLICPPVWAATYKVDPDHSSVGFKIRHLLSYVRGEFNEFEGTLVYDPEHPETWTVSATIHAASIDTRVPDRDTHLRSSDFFDVEHYPTVTFTSTRVTEVTATGATLHGTLSIHGVEKPVVLDLQIHGVAKDPWGNVRSAFTATPTINRKDFGVMWNKVLETGHLLVGEDVEITIDVEGIAQE